MKYKYMILFLAIILSLSFVSAWEFDNVKDVRYDKMSWGYPEITIKNSFAWIIPLDKIGDYKITNLECGFTNCKTKYHIVLYKDAKLFDKEMKVTDVKSNNEVFISYEYYIKTGTKEIEVSDYKQICEVNENEFESCRNEIVGTHKEVQDIYEKYNYEEVKAGEYDIELRGKIPTGASYDVKPYGQSVEFTEHAVWTSALNTNIVSYWKLDESSGTLEDIVGVNEGTASGGVTYSSAGKINTAVALDGTGKVSVGSDASINFADAPFTISAWVKRTDTGTTDAIFAPSTTLGYALYFNAGSGVLRFGKPGVNEITSTDAVGTGAYHHVAVVYRADDKVDYYIDGVADSGGTASYSTTFSTGRTYNIGLSDSAGSYFNGSIDEVGIWGRNLSATEISDLYNGGVGLSYPSITLSATQSYPANNSNTSTTTPTLACNFTGSPQNNISSVKVNVYDNSNNLDYTNTDAGNKGVSYNKTWTTTALTDDTYKFSCFGYGNKGVNASTGNWTFNLDSTKPTITINTPTGNQGIQTIPYNVTLNYTASDLRLQSCWFNSTFNATKTYTPCNITNITSVPNGNTNRIYVYANDSFGNENVSYTSFYPSGTLNQVIYSNSTVEGSTEKFALTFQSNTLLPTVSYLVYNNTNYLSSVYNIATNIYQMNNTVTIPFINTNVNMTFFWNVTYNDSTSANSPSYNQSVFNFGLDNCTSNSLLLFNITLYNEDNLTRLNGGAENTSLKIDLIIKTLSGITLLNYSTLSRYTNPVRLCLATSVNSSSYLIDGILQYSSLNNFEEFYNIQRYTLDNSSYSTQIPLYDLNTSTGTEFKISYKDSNFIPVADALIYIQRKYIDEGLFRTVEIPKTGSDGKATAHLVRSNTIYNILFVKDGATLGTFSNIIPSCQNPELYACEINLNSLGSGTIPSDYSNVDDMSFTLTFNKTTRTVSSTYTITSGVPSKVSLNLTVFDVLGNTTISSDSLTSAGGDLSANVPNTFGNGTVIATLYKDNQMVGRALIKLDVRPSQLYNGSLVFIALFGIVFIVGLAISDDPMKYGTMLVLGLIALIGLNIIYTPSWVGVGATILWLIVAIVIIMMKGSDRQ